MSRRDWSEKDLVNKWKRKLPPELLGSLPWDVLLTLVQGLSDDTKLPRAVLLECIRTRDISGLFAVASNLDVTVYTSADLLLQDRLVVELFSKFNWPNSPFNKRERAKLRFFEAEESCRETNFRVGRWLALTNENNAVIHGAIRHIQRILGKFNANEMLAYSRFGPGATLCVKGPYTTEYFKLSNRSPSVSTDAFPYAEALLAFDVKWKGFLLGIEPLDIAGPLSPISGVGVELAFADHNKVTFVPKNAKTERSIAIEPYFNIYFQLGVGGMIRQRLYSRCGVNLDSQLRNQMLARKGSVDGSLATIDFSMASDTISLETVRALVPPSWFEHLDRLRSKRYLMDGSLRTYQKFSSMGNGFTFELETLIFYAVALATCEHLGLPTEDITVFGDDVLLPSEGAQLYADACSYLGFKVNEEKSFFKGSFRESCGEDFLGGFRVRPVFCKELSTVRDVASLANRLYELNRSVGVGSRINDMLDNAVNLLHSRIPCDVRRLVVGPPSENYDGYIHTGDVSRIADSPLVKWDRNLFCWRVPCIRFTPKVLQRHNSAVSLWLNMGLAMRQKPIRQELEKLESLARFSFGRFPAITDYVSERDRKSVV